MLTSIEGARPTVNARSIVCFFLISSAADERGWSFFPAHKKIGRHRTHTLRRCRKPCVLLTRRLCGYRRLPPRLPRLFDFTGRDSAVTLRRLHRGRWGGRRRQWLVPRLQLRQRTGLYLTARHRAGCFAGRLRIYCKRIIVKPDRVRAAVCGDEANCQTRPLAQGSADSINRRPHAFVLLTQTRTDRRGLNAQ